MAVQVSATGGGSVVQCRWLNTGKCKALIHNGLPTPEQTEAKCRPLRKKTWLAKTEKRPPLPPQDGCPHPESLSCFPEETMPPLASWPGLWREPCSIHCRPLFLSFPGPPPEPYPHARGGVSCLSPTVFCPCHTVGTHMSYACCMPVTCLSHTCPHRAPASVHISFQLSSEAPFVCRKHHSKAHFLIEN